MKHQVLFCIKSEINDEKNIHTKMKNYLSLLNRTTSTAKNQVMLDSFLPFRIKHYHWNLNKETGTFFALFPNYDLDGKIFIPKKPECKWILKVLFHEDYPGYEQNKSEEFIINLLKSIEYEYEIAFETDSKDSVKYGNIK